MRVSLFRSFLQSGLVALGLGAGVLQAEMREFTDVQGRKITAEPVSHNGSGVVEFIKEGGTSFELEVSRLSEADQAFIQEWMTKNPAKMDYRFEVKAVPDKQAGTRRNFGYKKVKNELWAYKIEIKNLARNTVSGLKVEYRVFVKNEAQGAYASSDMGGYHSGDKALPDVLRYNESTSFVTAEVPLDSVNYDYANDRHQDALRGVMLRIKDAQGKVVHEYVSPITTLKGKTWDGVPKALEIKAR